MTREQIKCAIYCRVSVEDKRHNGVSLEMQEARLRDYARAKDWEVVGVYIDRGKSGRTLDRPALARLRTDAKAKKFSTVLIYKLDRLVRSVPRLGDLLEEFDALKVSLVSLSESIDATTSGGRLMMNLLGSVAQWEREVIAERTVAALAHKRDQGEVYGPIPLGFVRKGTALRPVERELQTVRRIYALRKEGHTLRDIAGRLEAGGIKTKTGKTHWSPEGIRLVLKNLALYQPFLDRT
jgi:site-specific DNA recombinase